MSTFSIQTDQIRKEFGPKVAIRSLTLEVAQGEVFGFLGPNGAGKTTSMKILLGLVRPTSGKASLLDRPLGDVGARRWVGFLPEHFRFHEWLTGEEFLTLHGQLYGLAHQDLLRQTNQLLERVGLEEHRKKQLRTYSKGMLQRIGLAQALLNHPRLVFLDEPTSGLDPIGRRLVRDIIHETRQAGATVFLNSHLLSEVEITCDRVAFIKHGEVLQISRLDQLVEGEMTVAIRVKNVSVENLAGLSRFAQNIRQDGDLISLTVPNEAEVPGLVRWLTASGADVYAVQPQKCSLEDLFIKIVGTDGGL